jgi:hypothetical protein
MHLSLSRRFRHMGSRGVTPFILNLGISWRFVVKFTTPPSYTRKKLWYPLDSPLNNRFFGPQNWYGRSGGKKIVFPHFGIRTLNPVAHNIDTIPTTAFPASTRELLITSLHGLLIVSCYLTFKNRASYI